MLTLGHKHSTFILKYLFKYLVSKKARGKLGVAQTVNAYHAAGPGLIPAPQNLSIQDAEAEGPRQPWFHCWLETILGCVRHLSAH